MQEVKIREATENILVPAPLGMQINQPHKYLELYFVGSEQAVPDDSYTLKQGEREKECSVIAGQVRGAEWINPNESIFLV